MNWKTCRLLLLMLVVVASGCGTEIYPPVSGKVTAGGEPVAGAIVAFAPKGSKDNPIPGPYSIGVTDAQGKFNLRTRRDDPGAVPGNHNVSVYYGESDELGSLKSQLRKADEVRRAKIKEEIAALRANLKSRKKIPENISIEFVVPKEGTSAADFELYR